MLFIKSNLSLHEFGGLVKAIFNAEDVQLRDSMNKGGEYWLMKVNEDEISILLNEDESVFTEEMAEYKFVIASKNNTTKNIETTMKDNGIECALYNL